MVVACKSARFYNMCCHVLATLGQRLCQQRFSGMNHHSDMNRTRRVQKHPVPVTELHVLKKPRFQCFIRECTCYNSSKPSYIQHQGLTPQLHCEKQQQ